jgi:hypothetical protein
MEGGLQWKVDGVQSIVLVAREEPCACFGKTDAELGGD